jgi:hypothetical protein
LSWRIGNAVFVMLGAPDGCLGYLPEVRHPRAAMCRAAMGASS